jgi:hypothetical protein
LFLGIDVLQGDVGILKLLVGAGQVDFVGAADVAQFSAAALANDLDGGLVVFENLKMHIATEDMAPQLKGGQSLGEEAIGQTNDLGFGSRAAHRRLLLTDPGQREERVGTIEDQEAAASGLRIQAVAGEVGVDVKAQPKSSRAVANGAGEAVLQSGLDVAEQAVKGLVAVLRPLLDVSGKIPDRLNDVGAGKSPEPKAFHKDLAGVASKLTLLKVVLWSEGPFRAEGGGGWFKRLPT